MTYSFKFHDPVNQTNILVQNIARQQNEQPSVTTERYLGSYLNLAQQIVNRQKNHPNNPSVLYTLRIEDDSTRFVRDGKSFVQSVTFNGNQLYSLADSAIRNQQQALYSWIGIPPTNN